MRKLHGRGGAEDCPDGLKPFGHDLRVAAPALCPELALWLLDGAVDVNTHYAELLNGSVAPFWAFCWGSGQALARYLLDHPEEVREKRVVDFGAGGGVVAVAAARAGAARVLAVDTDSDARTVTRENAALNGVTVETADRLPELDGRCDLLVAADVLYELGTRALLHSAARRVPVLLADPHRHGAPALDEAGRDLTLTRLSERVAHTQPDVDYPVCRAWVYRLTRRG